LGDNPGVSLVSENPNPSQATSREVTIANEAGLHARPASVFVRVACKFASEVWVCCNDDKVNGKSIIGLLTLAASKGTRVVIEAEGSDAQTAVENLAALVEKKFQVD
jgi:phosphotransferase system HPr (HPr) family protein